MFNELSSKSYELLAIANALSKLFNDSFMLVNDYCRPLRGHLRSPFGTLRAEAWCVCGCFWSGSHISVFILEPGLLNRRMCDFQWRTFLTRIKKGILWVPVALFLRYVEQKEICPRLLSRIDNTAWLVEARIAMWVLLVAIIYFRHKRIGNNTKTTLRA